MLSKIALVVLVVSSSVASADVTLSVKSGEKPLIFRKSSNLYSVPGEGEIPTVNCTVSADGSLTARVERGAKPWLYFYDRQGRREADCQIATKPAPVALVKAQPIPRGIATVE